MDDAPPSKRRKTVLAKLRALNEQFAGWIQDQRLHHLDDVWIDGAEDYIQHARSLLQTLAEDSRAVNGAVTSAVQADAQSQPTSAPMIPPAAVSAAKKESAPAQAPLGLFQSGAWGSSQPSITFGSQGQTQSALPIPSPLTTGTPAAGADAPAFKAPAPLLSFGQNLGSSSGFSNGSGFNWGTTTDSTGGQNGAAKSASVSGGANDEEHAEEEGPKVFTPEVQLGAGSNLLFKETAKLYLKKPDKAAWDDRGNGTLTVRQQDASSGSPAHIVFTTESGRILVNGAVYKGIKVTPAKKPSMVVTNLTLATDEGTDQEVKLTAMLFNLGKAEKASTFISIIEEGEPK